MRVVGPVFVLQGVYHGEVHLYDTPLLILKDLGTLIFEPRFGNTILMTREGISVGLAWLYNPVDAIQRTLVPGYAPQPVVDD